MQTGSDTCLLLIKNIMRTMFFLFILGFLSCKKEPIKSIGPTPTPEPKLKIAWTVPALPDTTEYSSNPHALVNGNPIFATNFYNPSAFIQTRDKVSGSLIWTFTPTIAPTDGFVNQQIFSKGSKVMISKWHEAYCIDAQSGVLDWATNFRPQKAEFYATIIEEEFYKIVYWGSKPKTHTSSLLRTHYLSGHWDTLFTIHAKDSFHMNLYPPTLWINTQGDSVLILRDNALRDNQSTPHEGRYSLVNLYAWNMRTRQFDWVREDFEDEGSVHYGQPVIEGNRLYLSLYRSICCVDLLTGQTLWKRTTENTNHSSGLALHEHLLLATGNDHGMWGIDKNTGQTVWYNDKVYGAIVNLTCFDGIAYGTSTGSGNLYAVNAATGQIIWSELSPNRKGKTQGTSWGWSGVVIDPERQVLYIADDHYLMCIELAKL